MLRILDVRKSFGAEVALAGVTLEVGETEFVSFLGPSGCGKTTLLRVIAGLEVPDSGSVWLGSEQFVGENRYVPPERRDLGMVFQSYALWPHMTVYDNLAYPMRVRKVRRPDIEQRVMSMLTSLSLTGLAQRRPSELSGGQQQRVALGRALITHPRALLLDEPLSNVDAKVRQEMRTEVRRVQQEAGVGAIYVTHDQSEALAMSDRIVVMRHGSIEQVGTPEEVYNTPATRFVAEFIGACVLSGRVVAGGEKSCVRVDSLETEVPVKSPLTLGQRVSLAVHRERVRIVAPGTPGAGRARALVTSFLGERIEVELETGGARLRGLLQPGTAPPKMGDEVGVLLDPGVALVAEERDGEGAGVDGPQVMEVRV